MIHHHPDNLTTPRTWTDERGQRWESRCGCHHCHALARIDDRPRMHATRLGPRR